MTIFSRTGLGLGGMDVGPAAAEGGGVGAEVGVGADPAWVACAVDEGDADGEVWLGVGEAGDFGFGAIGHGDPGFFEGDGVEIAGLDGGELARVDAGEAAHHFEEEHGSEAGIFSAGGPDDGFEWVDFLEFDDVNVVAGD
jgi:hypothetical protein